MRSHQTKRDKRVDFHCWSNARAVTGVFAANGTGVQTPVLRFLQVGPAPRARAAARIMFAGSGALAPGDPLPNVCIHGHTHIPEIVVGKEARPADLLLCPGSPTNPRGGFPQCVAKIDVWEGRILRAWVERTTRGPHCGEVVLRHDFA